jgi:hypothetical protein
MCRTKNPSNDTTTDEYRGLTRAGKVPILYGCLELCGVVGQGVFVPTGDEVSGRFRRNGTDTG